MDREVREMIAGHSPKTVGEEYGDLWLDVMSVEIERLPRYQV